MATQNYSGKTTGCGEPFRHPVRLAHEAVAEQARRRPGATAVIAGDARLTYGELDQSANRLARYLTGLGAGPETLVGVCLERGAGAIRGLLAIMKAGAHPEALVPDGLVPVGRPAGHARIVVLDEDGEPVPAGTAGEIWIGGCGVARGYLDDAGLTAAGSVPAGTGSGCTERVMPDAGVPTASWR